MNRRYDDYDSTAGIWGFIDMLFDFAVLSILAGFFVSTWLTRMLFQWLLLPWFPDLEKHDGLVIIVCSGLWSLVSGLGIFPYLLNFGWVEVAPDAVMQGWWTSVAVGALWGSVVATWVLVVWWEKIIAAQPQVPLFAQMAGVDPAFFQPEPHNERENAEESVTIEDLEAEFARLVANDFHIDSSQLAVTV